jgi:hypothetical protein
MLVGSVVWSVQGKAAGLKILPLRAEPGTGPYNPLSTTRRKPGILMDVHPVLPRIAEASQLQLPRPGPDGQPTESSHQPAKILRLLLEP